jgi:hypothetical protein
MSGAWYPRFIAMLDALARTPLVYSESDCLCDIFAMVADRTGTDLAAPYRGRYASYDEGLALLQADGFAAPVDFVRHHFEEIHPLDASDGDIGAIPNEDGILGFGMFDRDTIFVKTEHGTGRLRRSRAMLAFRVA